MGEVYGGTTRIEAWTYGVETAGRAGTGAVAVGQLALVGVAGVARRLRA